MKRRKIRLFLLISKPRPLYEIITLHIHSFDASFYDKLTRLKKRRRYEKIICIMIIMIIHHPLLNQSWKIQILIMLIMKLEKMERDRKVRRYYHPLISLFPFYKLFLHKNIIIMLGMERKRKIKKRVKNNMMNLQRKMIIIIINIMLKKKKNKMEKEV